MTPPPRATPSPNIWRSPAVYERLNQAADPDRLVVRALDRLLAQHLGTGVGTALDVGCGSGFHLPMLAERAGQVIGVEPHPALVDLARRRVERARLSGRVRVERGYAEALPAPDATVDLVFSHWAYFFGPGCEPGLAEARRVLRPGGLQVAVDLDVASTVGYPRWFAASGTAVRADRTAAFFTERGWAELQLPVVWTFRSRADLVEVLGIEFPPEVAQQAERECVGRSLAVPTALRWRIC